MKLLKFFKSLIDGFILKKLVKKSFGDAQGFADGINRSMSRYWNLRIINNNKYLTRSVQGVLYLYNYNKTNLGYETEYDKQLCWATNKRKMTAPIDNFDYDDYKKIIFYDDLYETYMKQYLYWEIPDGNPTEPLIIDFVAKVESYPYVKLKDVKTKFGF